MTTLDIIRKTKAAWSALRDADAETKNRFLTAMADSLVDHTAEILTCNEADLEAARGHISDVMLDRLRLDEGRIAAMAEGIRATVKLPDHTGRILSETHHANGMTIYKKQVPLGLVAIIYESRPNVTSDAAALTVKSGNVCVLRSGKEAVPGVCSSPLVGPGNAALIFWIAARFLEKRKSCWRNTSASGTIVNVSMMGREACLRSAA